MNKNKQKSFYSLKETGCKNIKQLIKRYKELYNTLTSIKLPHLHPECKIGDKIYIVEDGKIYEKIVLSVFYDSDNFIRLTKGAQIWYGELPNKREGGVYAIDYNRIWFTDFDTAKIAASVKVIYSKNSNKKEYDN